jgi:hypothetical protein
MKMKLNSEAKLFVPGVGSVTPPPKKNENAGDEEVEVSPLNWTAILEEKRELLEDSPKNDDDCVMFTPVRAGSKAQANDEDFFDRSVFLEREIRDVYDHETNFVGSAVVVVDDEAFEDVEKNTLLSNSDSNNEKKKKKKKSAAKTTKKKIVEIKTKTKKKNRNELDVMTIVAARSDDDEDFTPKDGREFSQPLMDFTNGKGGEYGTNEQPMEVLFPKELREPLLIDIGGEFINGSAEKKTTSYGANEEGNVIADEEQHHQQQQLWMKETMEPLLGGGADVKNMEFKSKLTFTNYGADDEGLVADWGDAKVPLLSASAGNTPRYLDEISLLQHKTPFSYGTAVDKKNENIAGIAVASVSFSSEEHDTSESEDENDDDDDDEEPSAKLLLEQFLGIAKKPKPFGYNTVTYETINTKSTSIPDVARNDAAEPQPRQQQRAFQFKPLLKTPPRLQKVVTVPLTQPTLLSASTSSSNSAKMSRYTPLTTENAQLRKNALKDDLCCVFHAVLVSRPEILEKHLSFEATQSSSTFSLRSRIASLEPRRSTRRRLDRFEAIVESFLAFALGFDGEDEKLSFEAFTRAMRCAATAAARMTTFEGVRDAVEILADFELLLERSFSRSPENEDGAADNNNNKTSAAYRHRCSRRLRAYKNIINILKNIKRSNDVRETANITVDRVVLLISAIDIDETNTEITEGIKSDDDYLYALAASARKSLASEIGARIDDSRSQNFIRHNNNNNSSNRTAATLSETIARRRQIVDAWIKSHAF